MMGVVERRQAVPVLSHLLLRALGNTLTLIGSDQEQELIARLPIELHVEGEMTLPARKLTEICRNLSSGSVIGFDTSGLQAEVSCDRFRSQLRGLPAHDFPTLEPSDAGLHLTLNTPEFRQLLTRVEFAMAQQDVRYFFNGLLLDFIDHRVIAVATNGQRLARSEILVDTPDLGHIQAIIPRKAIAELLKLTRLEGETHLTVTNKHIKFDIDQTTLTTGLIDATYPDYQKAIPRNGNKFVQVNRGGLREAVVRMSIVSNELYRNVRLQFTPGQLQLSTNNPHREEAEETLDISYSGEPIEIGFNANYLIELLNRLGGNEIQIVMSEAGSAVLFQDLENSSTEYVVSPMVI